MTIARTLIVSHRLPVTVHGTADIPDVVPSNGGLATGLRAWHEQSDGRWFGSPGDLSTLSPSQREDIDRQLAHDRLVPVHLSNAQLTGYCDGFSNRVLWPIFHYLIDHVPPDAAGWDAYRNVNETFADAVAREYRSNDIVWVHDYQLMLAPALIRARIPDARIGFFLHIPFPSSEVFRILPWRREILHGLLGADLIGFHTFAYMRHFMMALLHVEGVEANVDRVRIEGREAKVGVFPMGIDARTFEATAATPSVAKEVEAIRRDAAGRRILLGVDRLDYTKGLPRRLDAIESLLDRYPELRNQIRYIQVAVPSRENVDAYQQFRKTVEERVGRINGAYGTVGSLPIHYIYRSVSSGDLIALYRAADIMLVTPLRDGMNLVAKEFVASRPDEDGVLVLSEFAGAADELSGAVTVNPYDIHGVADGIHRAMTMPLEERRARMRTLRRRVMAHDIHGWARTFVEQLVALRPSDNRPDDVRRLPPLSAVIARAQRSRSLRLLLDYDGTLVPLARSPELAAPDTEILTLLARLAKSPGILVDIVSGRTRDTLERWFGALPVTLWGEHGYWYRAHRSTTWTAALPAVPGWMARVRPILDQFTATTPGSHVEVKTASLAWHYRAAPRDFGAHQAHELRMLLGNVLANQPLEVLEGKKVIEVRLRGVSKALVAQQATNDSSSHTAIVAIGDDRADEELFEALPSGSITVAVGRPWSSAMFSVDDYRAVRRLLRLLVVEPGVGPSAAACLGQAATA